MEIIKAFGDTVGKWIVLTVNTILFKLGLPINIYTQILFLFVLGIILYLAIDVVIWFVREVRRSFRPETKSIDSIKEMKKDNGLMKKLAALHYHEINPPPKGSIKWERTGRSVKSICLAKRRVSLQKSEEMLLLFPFNGEWFFFRNPKLLVNYQIDLFDKEIEMEKERGDLDFNWVGQPMKIHPKYRAQYEVEVEGHYPHLGQNEKRVSLLLAEYEETEINEGIEDRFLLFEDTDLIGGIAWQGKKIYLWTGGRLTKEEVAEIQDNYLEKEVNGIEPDFDSMK